MIIWNVTPCGLLDKCEGVGGKKIAFISIVEFHAASFRSRVQYCKPVMRT